MTSSTTQGTGPGTATERARRPLVERLGFGVSGVVVPGVDEDAALACLESAWDRGIRWFDVAPMYGDGRAEALLGRFLAGRPRDSYQLSTKVGRLVRPELARQAGLIEDWIYDFTADGVRRSLDESLARLGVDRLDALLVHDSESRDELVLSETWPAVARMRDEGVVGAAGFGMQLADDLARFVERLDVDLVLVAGRYTLVDPVAADSLLPMCQDRGVRVFAAEALHAGLVRTARHPHFNYRPVPGIIADHVRRVARVCAAHGVDVEAVALQFPLAHPAVDMVLTGPEDADQLAANIAWLEEEVPAEVWEDLRTEGLLRADLPTP